MRFRLTPLYFCLPALSVSPDGDLFPLKLNNWWTYKGVDENNRPFEIKSVVESEKPGKDGVIAYKVATGTRKESRFYSKEGFKTLLRRFEVAGQPSASIDFVPAKLVIDSKIRPEAFGSGLEERTKAAGETERWQVFPIEKAKVPAANSDCLKSRRLDDARLRDGLSNPLVCSKCRTGEVQST